MQRVEPGFEIVTLQSGVRTLRSRVYGETFHPVIGPMREARELHVQQQRLLERARASDRPFTIWDVGLGAAANALAVLDAFRAASDHSPIELHSFDESLEPLRFAIEHAAQLEYLTAYTSQLRELLRFSFCELPAENVRWQFWAGDFREVIRNAQLNAPHAILYDPYSATANPGMWTLEQFTRVRQRTRPDTPCLLTNYTRSTAVRVTLLLAGFFVGRGCAIGEKAETTIASNVPDLLAAPLAAAWLDQVRRSTRSAPLRDAEHCSQKISAEDFAALEAHPQFRCAESA